MANIIKVEEAGSTNTMLAALTDAPHGTALSARSQTAGRGQRGNSWEAAPGKNLTFSLLLRPETIPAARQFEISEIVAIAIARVLRRRLDTDRVRIKWPNDIYYDDLKICGILIENTLCGNYIERSIAGIGINVNQERFLSDAPNPVSMLNIAGHEFDLDRLLDETVSAIVGDFDAYSASPDTEALTSLYRSMLWRGDGFRPYRDNLAGEDIRARIVEVSPSGILTLETAAGELRSYAFKEVTALLEP